MGARQLGRLAALVTFGIGLFLLFSAFANWFSLANDRAQALYWSTIYAGIGIILLATGVVTAGFADTSTSPGGSQVAGSSIRWMASISAMLHFFGIFLAVVGSSSSMVFPPPPLVNSIYESPPAQTYVTGIFMNNAYRFYAPEPGPTTVVWCILKYDDDKSMWYELPRRSRFPTRAAYQRHLSVSMLLDNDSRSLQLPSNFPPALAQGPISELVLSSYIRHLGKTQAKHPLTGSALSRIGIYRVQHFTPTGDEIRHQQRHMTDLVYYQPWYMGTFDLHGRRSDMVQLGSTPTGRPVERQDPIGVVLAGTLTEEFYPLRRENPNKQPEALIDEIDYPEPIRQFLLGVGKAFLEPRVTEPEQIRADIEQLLRVPRVPTP
jgi:hypothetical protein